MGGPLYDVCHALLLMDDVDPMLVAILVPRWLMGYLRMSSSSCNTCALCWSDVT